MDSTDIENELAWKIGPDFVQWKVATGIRDYWPLIAGAIGIGAILFFTIRKKG